MKRIIAFALTVMMTVGLLAGCGDGGKEQRVVNVCSWGEYIDESLIGEFEAQTGIHVNYQTAESNETLYSLLQTGGADFDVIVPSDYMIGRLIDEGMLAELDYSAIPNYDLIDPQYKSLSFDPENKYTVPYSWGTVGIIYNTKMVDEPITSWGAMFDEKYAGQVLMINNSRDALMAALCYLGYDINTTDEAQLDEAFQLVKNAKDKGVYQAFVMDEIFGKMEGGNAAIAMYYAGDYLTMLENNEDLAFVVPEEGSNWFVDAMCVLKSSQHRTRPWSGSTSSPERMPAWPIWTISGTPPPTPRRWRSTPPTTRSRTARRWIRSSTTSWRHRPTCWIAASSM